MFKVGDEVLIKAEITDVSDCSERPYFVAPDIYSVNWVSEDKIIPMDKTYEQGLADSWNLLKKVYDMKCETIEQIFDVEGGFWNVIRDFTYEEALAKIEAYEKEKEIEVNDIVKVKDESGLGIVTAVCPTRIVYVLWNDGGCGDYEPCELEKTGRTAEGLDLLLRQIAE